MASLYRTIVRPILFLFAPEKAHKLAMYALVLMLKIPIVNRLFQHHGNNPSGSFFFMGLKFKNRVGIAAGFDKDGRYLEPLSQLGFGFVEVGTVTPQPQPGNDRPRLFRLKKDNALLNRMGFNNAGVDSLVGKLKNKKFSCAVGGNIGKNKWTPNDQSENDYVQCFEALYDYVDYFVVNVSSPNTPNLRSLQEKAPLMSLLQNLQSRSEKKSLKKPILVKIAPNLNDAQLNDVIDIVNASGIAGVVATNTTIDKSGLKSTTDDLGGGISGKPLKDRSTEIVRKLRKGLPSDKVIIGVGGIFTKEDAMEKLNAGADLVQIYTGFIYEGPNLLHSLIDI